MWILVICVYGRFSYKLSYVKIGELFIWVNDIKIWNIMKKFLELLLFNIIIEILDNLIGE